MRKTRGRILDELPASDGGQSLLDGLAGVNGDTARWLREQGRILKNDRHSLAGLIEIDGRACFAKLYRHKNSLRALFPTLTARRARGAWRSGLALHTLGVPVPQPLCCLLLSEGALLLTTALDNCEHLAGQWQDLSSDEQAQSLVEAARALAAVHTSGYAHGDAKWQNLVFVAGRCHFVDLDRARPCEGDIRGQARDIARFTVSAEEVALDAHLYAEFLDAYLSAVNYPRQAFVDQAARYAQTFRQRHRRRYGIAPLPLL